jgi:hypothetical protein
VRCALGKRSPWTEYQRANGPTGERQTVAAAGSRNVKLRSNAAPMRRDLIGAIALRWQHQCRPATLDLGYANAMQRVAAAPCPDNDDV